MRRGSSRRFDWVYRGYEYDDIGTATSLSLPGYTGDEFTITTGVTNARACVLYDSQSHTMQRMNLNAATGLMMNLPRSGRAEGKRALVKRVEGGLLTRPSSWAVGNLILWGWAIMIAEQDAATGVILLEPTWSLFDSAAGLPFQDITLYRNQPQILAAGDHWRAFSSNSTSWTLKPSWSSTKGRLLQPNEALFLYLEASNRSVSYSNMVMTARMRALVADEG